VHEASGRRGLSRIFQISHCFRAGERGDKHLPEFTMLEWYVSGFDYQQLMDQCENMICYVAKDLGVTEIIRQNHGINATTSRAVLSPPLCPDKIGIRLTNFKTLHY